MLNKLRRAWAILGKPVEQRTLSDKIIISGALSSIDHVIGLVFRFGSTLIITRLLAPEIFGLFAVVMTVQYILFMITDFGTRSLIIVSENAEDSDFLRTCWSIQIIRGFLLWGLVAFAALGLYLVQWAGLVDPETAYGASVLPAVLAFSGMPIAIKALETVNQHLYAREMRFRNITILNIILAVIGPLLTIAIALVHPTIWALVISSALTNTLAVILGFRLFPGTSMRWRLKREYVSELLRRGRWIMSNSALRAITNQADQLVFGAFLPAPMLGVYFLAKQIFSVIPGLLQKLHSAVGLQMFSDLITRGDLTDMRKQYYRYRTPIDLAAYSLAGITLTVSPALIDLMYDPRYLEAGNILQILGLGLPLTGVALIRDAFSAQKRFHIMALIGLIQALSIWIGLIIALIVLEDQTVAFLVVALHRVPENIVLMILARREGWVELRREIRFSPLILGGALVGWGLSELYFNLKV